MFTLFVASRKRYEKAAFGVVSQFEKNGKVVKSKTVKIAGFDKDNGTSRTDLLGVIEAVRTVPIDYKGEVKIKVSDPWLVKVMGIKDGESMFSTWVKNGFKKADGKPLINSWLYEILHVELEARKKHGVTFSIGRVDSTNNPAGQVAYKHVTA